MRLIMLRVKKTHKGFTLIELLVVIAVIGLMSSVIMVSLNSARLKARNAKRIADLLQIRTALELYNLDLGSYPTTNGWRSQRAGRGSYDQAQVAPGLVPNYIASMPADPSTGCYIYNSDGISYKFLERGIPDMALTDVNGQFSAYKDLARNDLASTPPCNVPDSNISLSIWNTQTSMCW